MQNNTIRILSTRPLDETLLQEAVANGVCVDVISFIETVAIENDNTREAIERLSSEVYITIFTSMNAVDAVISQLQKKIPAWKIFCMGNTTRQLVEDYFGTSTVMASASNASELANSIIDWTKTHELNKPIVFFCGDQRRNELPGKLYQYGIELQEIIIYHTIETTHKVADAYDGILFFSPSAVHSFFKINTVSNKTLFFAIGETTASTIKEYTNNKIVIGDTPSKDDLLKKAVSWLSN
ncbi:MAG: uroporphyrinogen-III synthase [Bacteroidota bacterium]